MSVPLTLQDGVVVVEMLVMGPCGQFPARVVLDTGASVTVLRDSLLAALGYETAVGGELVRLTTPDGDSWARRLPVARCVALGVTREEFPIVSKPLPSGLLCDGFLGIDFLGVGRCLSLDFQAGQIHFDV